MNPLPMLRRLCLLCASVLALWSVTAAAVAARPIDCSADGDVGASRCLIATERVQSGHELLAFRAGPSSAGTMASASAAVSSYGVGAATAAATTGAKQQEDPPFLKLLLATAGIVAFMAHRRIGG